MAVPHPYLSRHLARHAALGGSLDDDHVPPGLLPWVAGDSVRGLLGLPHAHRADQSWLAAWAAVEPYLQDADFASRCSSLHLAYTALQYPGIPHARLPQEAAACTGSRLRVLWSQWAPPSNVLATLTRRSRSLAMAEGPDGAVLLAVGNESGGIELIDAATGAAVGDRIPAHEGAVRCLSFVPHPTGGGVLVSGSTDGTVRIWDTNRGTLVNHMRLRGHTWTSDVTGYRSDAGSLTVAAVNGEGTLTLWREDSREHHLTDISPHPLDRAAFTLTLTTDPDGRRLLVSAGRTLGVWNIADHQLLHEYPLGAPVRSLTSTTVPGCVATGHSDGSITVWDTASGARASFPGEGEPVIALAALRIDGLDLLAAAGSGSPIELWDIGAKQWAGRLTGHTDTVTALGTTAAAGDAPQLASTAQDNTIRLWDTHATRRALEGTDTAPAAVAAAITTGSDAPPHLAVSYATAQVQVWDTSRGTATATFSTAPEHPVSALAWAPGDQGQRLLLWAAADHSIRSWDLVRSTTASTPLVGHSERVRALASTVACDGQRLAISGGDDFTARLWDLDSGQPLQQWRHPFRVRTVAAASDGIGRDWFASGSADGIVRLWDARDQEPGHVLYCQQGVINAIAINLGPSLLPSFLASGGDDGTVRLWDLFTHAPLGEQLQGHTDAVEAIATWTTSGDDVRPYVASSAQDGTLRIWEAATSRCVLQLATGSRVRTLSAHLSDDSTGSVILTMAGEAGVAVLELDLEDLSPS
ncbi:WD40 repeat domain-containing protein [Streptomyces sp. NPDC002668]|uniref:WD40 repeat domain-containing protein n=1 Tax=Streptomyces sp. NPDC002668 TaxID=3154422 RepID=UPI00332FD0EF